MILLAMLGIYNIDLYVYWEKEDKRSKLGKVAIIIINVVLDFVAIQIVDA